MGTTFFTAPHFYPAFQATYAQATFQLILRRNPTYYYTRYVLNIALLILMSLLGALLSPLETSRIMLSVTLFLGVVSWMFVLIVDAPKSDEPTRMDLFFSASFAVLLLQALYFTARNHSFDPLLAPLPFWKGGGACRSRGSQQRSAPEAAAAGHTAAAHGPFNHYTLRRRGRAANYAEEEGGGREGASAHAAGAAAPSPTNTTTSTTNTTSTTTTTSSLHLNSIYSDDFGQRELVQQEAKLQPAPEPQAVHGQQAAGGESLGRAGSRQEQEREFVRERVWEAQVVNGGLLVAYVVSVVCIFY